METVHVRVSAGDRLCQPRRIDARHIALSDTVLPPGGHDDDSDRRRVPLRSDHAARRQHDHPRHLLISDRWSTERPDHVLRKGSNQQDNTRAYEA